MRCTKKLKNRFGIMFEKKRMAMVVEALYVVIMTENRPLMLRLPQ